ncbi:MAG: replicative DNA helicase [Anaerolineales bacterium]|nr:replicative DNA helicase [Anaerolineales bacterium]
MSDFPFSPADNPPSGDGRSTRELPHDRQAEEAVLGAIMVNPEVYYDVAHFLTAEDFFLHRNRWVWEAFAALHDQRLPVDILTVSEELERQSRLDEVGGPAYLTSLINNVPSSLHAEAYARTVEETATRRRLLSAANTIARLAYQTSSTIEEVVNDSEKSIFGVSEHRLTHQLQPIKHVLSEYYDRIDYLARHRDETIGVPTGFIDLDRLLGGLQSSDLLIIAGRPGQGKSGFCLSVAKNASQIHKKHVALFSLEMSNEQLVQRLVAQETGIDSQRLRLANLQDDEWPIFTQAVSSMSETHIYLDDTPAITPLQLRTKCRRLHMEVGLDLIVIDYLQLMTGDSRIDNRVQEVSYISRNLKALARELNVPVLAAAQLSRAVESRRPPRPILSDLRESGSLEQDADVVLFIYRPDQYEDDTLKQNIAEIIVAKHRNGPVGVVELVFRQSLAKFENAATRMAVEHE